MSRKLSLELWLTPIPRFALLLSSLLALTSTEPTWARAACAQLFVEPGPPYRAVAPAQRGPYWPLSQKGRQRWKSNRNANAWEDTRSEIEALLEGFRLGTEEGGFYAYFFAPRTGVAIAELFQAAELYQLHGTVHPFRQSQLLRQSSDPRIRDEIVDRVVETLDRIQTRIQKGILNLEDSNTRWNLMVALVEIFPFLYVAPEFLPFNIRDSYESLAKIVFDREHRDHIWSTTSQWSKSLKHERRQIYEKEVKPFEELDDAALTLNILTGVAYDRIGRPEDIPDEKARRFFVGLSRLKLARAHLRRCAEQNIVLLRMSGMGNEDIRAYMEKEGAQESGE